MLDGRIACKSTDLMACTLCTLKVAPIVFMEEEIRPALSLERRSQPHTNPLDYCDAKLFRRFRMPRNVFLEVVDLVKHDLEPPTKRSESIYIPALIQCALRFFASGQLQEDSGDIFGFSQPTVSRIVKRVAANAYMLVKGPHKGGFIYLYSLTQSLLTNIPLHCHTTVN